jgi:hypothetical protein
MHDSLCQLVALADAVDALELFEHGKREGIVVVPCL